MKDYKKKDIRKFYKKSIWPSVILFFLFIGICVVIFFSSIFVFERYVLDTKIGRIRAETENLGRFITSYMEEGSFDDAVSQLGKYLGKERDICVTDEENHVLKHFGSTVPDFEYEGDMEFIGPYTLIPDSGQKEDIDVLLLPVNELLLRSLEALPDSKEAGNDGAWLDKSIYSIQCWMEIPVQIEGFRLYYKDSMELLQKNIIFIVSVILVEVALLMIPIILLLINMVSSLVMQRRMIKLLYLDTVTGGKNWAYFIQRSKMLLCQVRNAGNTYVLINLHMKRYQDYCTCYGNKAGEELLKSIHGFLQMNVGNGESFARFAKADFGLLLQCDSMEQGEKRLKRLLAELTGIKKDRALAWCAGIYLIHAADWKKKDQRRRQIDVEQAYHYANAARVTLSGKEGKYIGVFDDQILQEQLWKNKVENSMEEALLNKEFQLYLQPKYHPVSEKIVGAEALVRWLSPEDGLIAPARFIPIFEENGFITRLDDYMISTLAKLQSKWKLEGKKQVPVSINVSNANFTKERLAQHICQLVDAYGADHANIELEVAGSAFLGDKAMLQKIIRELKMYGFRISMDDFGAGYSSLNSLKDLPVDALKLDMDFFRGEEMGERGKIVVKEAIRLAKNLNMEVVAEGIEKKSQVEFLAEQGCDMIQGFYFARPMPVQEFAKRMEWDV